MHFIHFGCKVNQYETNAMTQKFIECGYKVVNLEENMDICVINTCTVTNMSDKKSRQALRKIKHKNPNVIMVAVGCYVQVAKDQIKDIPEIDIALGNEEKDQIIEHIERYEQERIYDVTDIMEEVEYKDFGSVTYTEKTRAVIKVQDGCNNFCSYCIIPYARGRVRSRRPENVLREVEKIVEKQIKEIVITGIHIASYGKDFDNNYELIDLLEDLNKINGLQRIRLGSIEPKLITDEFVSRLSKLEKICHHFHLSLQSGCDKTLKAMNRKYTTEDFRSVVKRLRNCYEDVILTTDIIVGFPEETDEDFNITYEFLKEIQFYKMHVFKYSPRKGTRAASMPNQISGEKKEERSKVLISLSNNNQNKFHKKYIGKEVEVLFEENENGYEKGHTANYMMVKVNSKECLENKIKNVILTEFKEEYLIGEFAV